MFHVVNGQYLPGGGCFLTNTHTVYESDKQTDDASCKDDNADVPEKTHYFFHFLVRSFPTHQTTGGSVSWRTIINPMQMRMRERLVRTIKQQTPCSKNSDYNGLTVKMIPGRILRSKT